MFVTSGQFYVFISCVAFGCVSGVLLGVSDCVKRMVKNRALQISSDVFAFVLICFSFVAYSYLLNFPNVRAYMFLGVFLGIVLTFKSFNIILAKIGKKIYNICVKKKRKIGNERKRF